MAKKPKFARAQIKNHIKKIQQAMEKQKREHEDRGEQFRSVTPEEIEKKLKRVNSPIFVGEWWTGQTTPGGTLNCGLTIYNPDATRANNLYAHVWVGAGNADPTVGTFLLNVDTRFPRVTQPAAFGGLTLVPGSFASLVFALKVSTTVEKATYTGQSCLMRASWFDTGQYLDRAMFVFE